MRELSIESAQEGLRLDKYLQKYMPKAPKSFFYKMLRKKNITRNGKKCDASERLAEGDVIRLFLSEETIEGFRREAAALSWPSTSLDFVWEDARAAIINKPAGMLSQKAKAEDVSLVEYLIGSLLERGELTKEELRSFRPSVCNRLDRNTSGLVAAGKDPAALSALSALFRERTVKKYYLCLVCGRMERGGDFTGWIKKDEEKNRSVILREEAQGSRPVRTVFRPLAAGEKFSLLEAELVTGKSHQLRAQLSFLGHPILGDVKYGDPERNRYGKEHYGVRSQLLHAWKMVFPKLSGPLSGLSEKTVSAPPPAVFLRTAEGEGLLDGEQIRRALYGDLGKQRAQGLHP